MGTEDIREAIAEAVGEAMEQRDPRLVQLREQEEFAARFARDLGQAVPHLREQDDTEGEEAA